MGSLKELGEMLRDAKGIVKEIKCKRDDINVSIAKKSAASTLQFPVIMSRSINVDTASNVVKALERQYAIFVQMTIQLNPVINWDEDDIPGFVQKIHQNTPTPIDVIESCINVYSDEELGLRMIMSLNEGCNGQVLRSNKEQMLVIEDYLNKTKLNDVYKPEQITLEQANATLDYFMLTEAKHRPKKDNGKQTFKSFDEFANAYNSVNNGENPEPNNSNTNVNMGEGAGGVNENKGSGSNPNKGAKANDRTEEPKASNTTKETKKPDPKQKESKETNKTTGHNNGNGKQEYNNRLRGEEEKRKLAIEKAKMKMDIDKANAEFRSRAIVKLADNDVKKCNELVPTTLSVTLQQIKGDNIGGNITFVLGIKGLMHPVNSDEMVSNLLDGYKDGNKFFNFLRWTSGEISFLKDLLFNVDGIKEDVIKKHNKGSHWWTTLKRNKNLARIKNVYGKNRILPNATIVCSMEEIMEIKDTYNVDLMDPKCIRKLMDRYFLLGFVVVDESQELCYFMFDGENEHHALSFKGLEKENNNKNDFKDIYKMINSGRL
jgi:hypothetical protein